MKNILLFLTSLLVLIFSSCKNIEQNTSLSETTTVTFATDNVRSIYTKLSNPDYTYTIRGKAKSGATFQTDRHYTYNELSPTRFEIQKGTWDFTMNVFTGEEVIFTGRKSVTIDKSSVISIPVYAKTGSTASLSVKLNFPKDKGVAKITAGLYDSVTDSDAGSALILKAGYVTYTNDVVPAATNKILKFYFYDCQDVCIASYIEGVYLAAQDNISVERTLSNVNTFAATVCVKDANGNDLTDSRLIIKAVKDDKEYEMTAVSKTNMYTASLPVGTYDVYTGLIDTDIDLVVNFLQGGNATIIFATTTKETIISTIARLTEDSTILMAGELTVSDLTVISDAIKNSTYNVNINLSLTTGLTSISVFAFRWCTKLSGIIIPDSVTSISDYAFYDCTSLSSVTIPDSVTSIGDASFAGCTSLEDITVDSNNPNYSSIDGVLFNKDATDLIIYPAGKQSDTYTIPNSVTTIGTRTFEDCTSLTTITVDSNNPNYSSIDGVLFNKDATAIITYPKGKQSATYTIPNSVTSIYNYAFYGCTSLSSVTIGESVKSIKYNAFEGCTSLHSVTIPDSVTSIYDYAFYGCTSLSSVTIGNSVNYIGYDAFSGCSSLYSVTFNCPITSGITQGFRDYVSFSVNIINSVNIGDSVTSIDSYAFSVFNSLTNISVDLNNANYSSIDGVLFNKDATALITHPAGKQSYTYTIPDSVTSIYDYAFYGCTSLFSVTFTDTTTWYRTDSRTDWNNKTNGTLTDVSDAATNAIYFKDTYYNYYWYKLDE
ncbi:MAG TPA: hypothetical protein DCF70_06550 [Treponema sp.]|nr:hypothetical protein [Treponema sp.]